MFSFFNKFIFLAGLFLLLVHSGAAENIIEVAGPSDKYAVLPFVNYSGRSQAPSMIYAALYKQLSFNNINFIAGDDLRPVLRKYRIRTMGFVNQNDAGLIMQETGVNKIIIGSINIFESIDNPKFSISARIIDIKEMKIVSASSISETGKDFEKLFGVGRIDSIDVLVDNLMKILIDDLFSSKSVKNQYNQRQKAALISFDNISDQRNAGLITTEIMLTQLVKNDIDVIEPGLVMEAMVVGNSQLRGEVTLSFLKYLHDSLKVDIIFTGQVDRFDQARGSSESSQPFFEFGARVLDASNGKIINMYNRASSGSESHLIFGIGKNYSLGKLVMKTINEFVKKFKEERRDYFVNSPN